MPCLAGWLRKKSPGSNDRATHHLRWGSRVCKIDHQNDASIAEEAVSCWPCKVILRKKKKPRCNKGTTTPVRDFDTIGP